MLLTIVSISRWQSLASIIISCIDKFDELEVDMLSLWHYLKKTYILSLKCKNLRNRTWLIWRGFVSINYVMDRKQSHFASKYISQLMSICSAECMTKCLSLSKYPYIKYLHIRNQFTTLIMPKEDNLNFDISTYLCMKTYTRHHLLPIYYMQIVLSDPTFLLYVNKTTF